MPSVWCYPCWRCLRSLPTQPHPPSHIGRLWANLFLTAGSISRQKSYPSAPTNPPPKLPRDLWMCVSERLKDAQGNAGLSCPGTLPLPCTGWDAVVSGARGACSPYLSALGGFSLLRRELSSSFWSVSVPTIVCLSVCLPACLSSSPFVFL